jgi:chromate transporter
MYSIGQLSPGPNMLMVLIIGYQIAGMAGATAVLFSFFLPSSIICLYVGRLWVRLGESPWRRTVQNALEPISIGLMGSGVYALSKESIVSPLTAILALISLGVILRTQINPVVVIVISGVIGAGVALYF